MAGWLTDMRTAIEEALTRVKGLPDVPHDLDAVIGMGTSWPETIEDVEWDEGDVLVVGTSSVDPVERVFLGSRAAKIVRHSPAPVVGVPRAAAEELAERAVQT